MIIYYKVIVLFFYFVIYVKCMFIDGEAFCSISFLDAYLNENIQIIYIVADIRFLIDIYLVNKSSMYIVNTSSYLLF